MSGRAGQLRIATVRGAPILVHWSFLSGGLIVALLARSGTQHWLHYCVAYTLLVLLHELGHVAAAKAFGLRVHELRITGLGGLCVLDRPGTARQVLVVYSAGLFVQAVAFVVPVAFVREHGHPAGAAGRAITMTFIWANAAIFLVNLLPLRDTGDGHASDGFVLWRLYLHVFRGAEHPFPPLVVLSQDEAPVFARETRLLALPGFKPAGFLQGIEILNDRTTPMELVIDVLGAHLGQSRDKAVLTMLEIHNKGGILIPLPDRERARQVAAGIAAQASAAGHELVCRYAEATP